MLKNNRCRGGRDYASPAAATLLCVYIYGDDGCAVDLCRWRNDANVYGEEDSERKPPLLRSQSRSEPNVLTYT